MTTDTVWLAYQQLEQSKVKKASPQKLLADIISLIRFTIGKADILEPWTDVEQQRFEKWLDEQKKLGREFTSEQMDWLVMIKDHITASLEIEVDDLQYAPFHEKGGAVKAYDVFGNELNKLLEELNEALAA